MITLKSILIFAGGAIVGAAGSWYYCKRHYEKVIEEFGIELEAQFKEMYGGIDAYVEEDEETPEIEPGERRGSYATNYAAFYKDPAEQEHPVEEETRTKGDKKIKPRVIKVEEFGNSGFAEVYLDFYVEDQALVSVDETEAKEIDEVRDWIGDALEKYGFAGNEDRIICVRNYNRKTDYQINKVWDRFAPSDDYE